MSLYGRSTTWLLALTLIGAADALAADAVDVAAAQLGKPYDLDPAAIGPDRFDCSGLVKFAFASVGILLPRTSTQQSLVGQLVGAELQRGDLLFFATDDERPGVVTHVGIFEGDNRMIDANSDANQVARDNITAPYWASRFLFAHRLVTNFPPTAGFTMTAGPESTTDGQTLILFVAPGDAPSVTFDASLSSDPEDGMPASFEWTLDGQVASTTSAFISPVGSGMHVISLVVRDSAGLPSASAEGIVAVQAFPPRFIQITDTVAGAVSAPAINRDGSVVAFVGWPSSPPGPLFTARIAEITPMPVTPGGLVVMSSVFAFAPFGINGDRLVFVGCGSACQLGDLYLVNADGNGLTPLTTTADVEGGHQAIVSGNGTKVAFVRFINNEFRLIVMNTDGTGERELAFPPDVRTPPSNFALNSDGSRLVLGYFTSGFLSHNIGIINTDGTGFQTVATNAGSSFVGLSGDGQTIAFSDGFSTEVIQADGTARTTLVPRQFGCSSGSPSVTFDGSQVVYWAGCGPGSADVFIVGADGTNRRNLTNTPPGMGASASQVSENGAAVVFLSSADLDPGRNTDLNLEVFAALLKPSLSIDGGAASNRSQAETFTFTGFGFTPNQPVTRRVRQPDGSEVILEPPMLADADGRISWTFQPTEATPFGTYLVWVIDDVTDQISNIVYETVIPVLQ